MNKTKSIHLFIPNLDGGGAEKVILNLAQGFVRQGMAVAVVAAQAEGAFLQDIPDGVELVDLEASSPVFVTKTLALKRHLQRTRPNYLLSTLDILGSAVLARNLAQVPTQVLMVVQTHLSQQFKDRHGPLMTRLKWFGVGQMYGRADAIAAASQGVATDLASHTPIASQGIEVIHNPVVTYNFYEKVIQPVNHPWFAPDQPPVILGVGRLVKQKDFATLVQAFAQVRQQRPARLVILGTGDKREPHIKPRLQAMIQELGIADDVDLPGFVSNPYAYMARAHVFALSSIYEGFGNVVAEALAAGTPVVSTDCESGPAEILDYGSYGILVPVKDAAALARGILDTLAQPTNPERSKQRGADFSIDKVCEDYLNILNRL
ncbi:glycosyl transferase [filamentous cyanobacterium CCP5]|nr:glycosyl transferase [filamentous cyanobacterium CCP5]